MAPRHAAPPPDRGRRLRARPAPPRPLPGPLHQPRRARRGRGPPAGLAHPPSRRTARARARRARDRERASPADATRTDRARNGDPGRRHVPVDGVPGREALAARRREGCRTRIPRSRARQAARRADRVLGRRERPGLTDDRPRARRPFARRHRDAHNGYGGTAIGDALARAVELARDAMRERELASVAPGPTTSVDGAVSILFGRPRTAGSSRLRRARASPRRRGSPCTPSRSAPAGRRRPPPTRVPGRALRREPATARRIRRRCG